MFTYQASKVLQLKFLTFVNTRDIIYLHFVKAARINAVWCRFE